MFKKISLSIVSLLSCLMGQTAFAITISDDDGIPVASSSSDIQAFQLQPRFNAWGFTGSRTSIEGQLLFPVYGDQTQALYAVADSNYGNGDIDWQAGVGMGYRQDCYDTIYGGYIIADYIRTGRHNGFTIINPGLEMLGEEWDLTVKGYIPLDNGKKTGDLGWAGDDFGDHRYTRPAGHDYYDHMLQQYEEPGQGVEVEVARVLPYFDDAKLHVSAYHFGSKDAGSTNGMAARVTYDLNKYSGFELENSYDNTNHHQFLIGMRFTFGGYSKEEKKEFGSAARLLDPIQPSSRGLVPFKKYIDSGERKQHDNVWYFRPRPSGVVEADAQVTGSGTAEDPFVGFSSGNYSSINPNIGTIDKYPLMYFAPGAYNFSEFKGHNDIDDRFNLPNGWGMYGRTADYKMPTFDGDRATFFGGLDLSYGVGGGGEPTTLNSISIINNKRETAAGSYDNAALYVANAGNVILQNTNIQNSFTYASSSISSNVYVYGIYANNSVLNFEKLNNETDGVNTVSGYASNTDTVLGIDNITASGIGHGYGIEANSSTINFNGGENTITGTGIGVGSANNVGTFIDTATGNGIGYGYGIEANSSTINFNGGENTITGTGIGTGIASNSSALEGTATGNGTGYGYGIAAQFSTISFNNGENTIAGYGYGKGEGIAHSNLEGYGNATGIGNGYGIKVNFSTVSFADGTNTITGNGSGSGFGYGQGVIDFPAVGEGIGSGTGNGFGYGIEANSSNVISSGGKNIISGTGSGFGEGNGLTTGEADIGKGYGIGMGNGYGVEANSSSITFGGGENAINGFGSGYGKGVGAEVGTGNGVGNGYGIDANSSNITFSSGENTIDGEGIGNGTGNSIHTPSSGHGSGYGYGIKANSSAVTFSNSGDNTINGKGTGVAVGVSHPIVGEGYGINAQNHSTVNFANTTDHKIKITVSGNTKKVGVYADSTSRLQRSGADLPSTTVLSDMQQYIDFTGTGFGGSAVQWDGAGHFVLPWP